MTMILHAAAVVRWGARVGVVAQAMYCAAVLLLLILFRRIKVGATVLYRMLFGTQDKSPQIEEPAEILLIPKHRYS